jgi:hypothetical protein
VLKQREGSTGRVLMSWDFDHMNFSGIYKETNDGSFDNSDEDDVQSEHKDNTIGID